MHKKGSYDLALISYFVLACGLGASVGFVGQPLIHGNEDAIAIIVNVFAILAGFLVTIMMLLSDPALYRGATWRSAELRKSNFYRRLQRHSFLFVLYLLVLALVFVASLLEEVIAGSPLLICLERIYLGAATTAFLLSLGLPVHLMNTQMDRYDEMVKVQEACDAAAAAKEAATKQKAPGDVVWDNSPIKDNSGSK